MRLDRGIHTALGLLAAATLLGMAGCGMYQDVKDLPGSAPQSVSSGLAHRPPRAEAPQPLVTPGATGHQAAGEVGEPPAPPPPPPVVATSEQRQAIVILIGIDALRWDIIDRDPAPHLNELAKDGVRAQGLIPVFPSLTFPNFYAIATGLYPGDSGVMDNTTYDRKLKTTFTISASAGDPRWFADGEPIWITAEKQGVRAATLFWVGSEVENHGYRPTYWLRYSPSMANHDRVAQVLDWLRMPEAQRPRLITLYFSAVDSACHTYGVNSPQEKSALADVDANIGELMAGVHQMGLDGRVNYVVVGDHGFTDFAQDRVVYLDDYLTPDQLNLSPQLSDQRHGNATIAGFFCPPPEAAEIYKRLALANPSMTVYRKADIPARYHYDNADRTPDVLVVPQLGWLLSRHDKPWSPSYIAGHGYDPSNKEMWATFLAAGPAFKSGAIVAPFENVNIYPLIANILGLTPAKTDGSLREVQDLLK